MRVLADYAVGSWCVKNKEREVVCKKEQKRNWSACEIEKTKLFKAPSQCNEISNKKKPDDRKPEASIKTRRGRSVLYANRIACSLMRCSFSLQELFCMLLDQSDQSQTLLRNEAMLTRLDLISNIHGCSSIRQGVALRLGSFSRLHSMKYLKFSLHRMSCPSGVPISSLSFGMGCETMYVKRSISPALGCISVPSAGKGNLCCATSSSVTPKLHTSEVMV